MVMTGDRLLGTDIGDGGCRTSGAGTGLLRRDAAREPGRGPTRPRAVDLQPARQPTHAFTVSHPRHARIKHYKEGLALRTETVINDTYDSRLWLAPPGRAGRRRPAVRRFA